MSRSAKRRQSKVFGAYIIIVTEPESSTHLYYTLRRDGLVSGVPGFELISGRACVFCVLSRMHLISLGCNLCFLFVLFFFSLSLSRPLLHVALAIGV